MAAAAVMLVALYVVCYQAGIVTDFTRAIGSDDPGPLRVDATTRIDPSTLVPRGDTEPGGPSPEAQVVLAQLDALPEAGLAPAAGYDPALFGAWPAAQDGDGCGTFDDILVRDLTDTVLAGCVVATGTLTDPYTGTQVAYTHDGDAPSTVAVDHVVSRESAWRTGAQEWDPDVRVTFANDRDNLLAVDAATSAARSGADAATWLPPDTQFRCRYVATQVQVKTTYDLWVTPGERDAIANVLKEC